MQQTFDLSSVAALRERLNRHPLYGALRTLDDVRGFMAHHAYSVWGTEVSGGKKYVQLRNPWGDSEPKNNGRDDGIFKMELSEFMKMYANVEINGG